MVALWLSTFILIVLTFIPMLELRAAIPLGILSGSVTQPFFGPVSGFELPWWYVFLVCVAANILLAATFYWFLDLVVHRFLLRWAWFARFYHRRVEKAQKRIHSKVERYGWLGLALFIGIPFPGTGVYTGGLAAYGLGMGFKKYLLASTLGVLVAGALVTAITLGVISLF